MKKLLLPLLASAMILGACGITEDIAAEEAAILKESQEKAAQEEANKPVDEKAKAIAVDVLGKENVKEVKLANDKDLFLTLTAKDNLTANMVRKGMLMYSSEILEKTAKLDGYESVNFIWQLPLVDHYGNEEVNDVMTFWLDTETLGKINWENFDFDNLTDISTDYYEHPALSK